MTDILTRKYKPSDDAVDARVGDETVILHMDKGTYFGLDAVGARIWELLGKEAPLPEIVNRIADEFDAEAETVEADARPFLEQLIESGLVVEV